MPTKRPAKRPPPRSRPRDEEEEYGERSRKETGELAVVQTIAALAKGPREICAKLHDIIMEAAPDIEPAIKWGMLVYAAGKLVCYCAPNDADVRFGFYDRAGLDGLDVVSQNGVEKPWPAGHGGLDPGTGAGDSIRYETVADVDARQVASWVKAAAARARGG